MEIASGLLDLSNLTENDAKLARAFLDLKPTWDIIDRLKRDAQASDVSISEAGKRFIAHKTTASRGEETDYTGKQRRELERFAENIGKETPVRKITAEEIGAWLDSLDVGHRRKKAVRATLCAFWRWMRKQDMIRPETHLTEAEKTPEIISDPKKEVRILSEAETRFLIKSVKPELLPWFVINCFSGVRTSEIRSAKKPPLLWRHVSMEEEIIEIPAKISKNRKRRLTPILPTLAAWLHHLGIQSKDPNSPIITCRPTDEETKRLGNLLDEEFKRSEGWPDNAPRHSYGSYRVAETSNVAQTAHEMDNSEKVIKEDYLKAVKKTEAERYFALTPSEVYRT